MPLVSLKPVLREAKAKGYAVAAFNPVDYASMKAAQLAAAGAKRKPEHARRVVHVAHALGGGERLQRGSQRLQFLDFPVDLADLVRRNGLDVGAGAMPTATRTRR